MKKTTGLILCLLAAGCVPVGSSGPTLEERVERQDIQLRQMQPQQADTWNQIQAMRQEIESLKGQLDDLNNAGGARALADRVRQHDAALRQVDDNMALNLNLGSPMAERAPLPPAPETGRDVVPITGTQGIQPSGAPDSSAYGTAAPQPALPQPAPQTAGAYGLIDETAPKSAPEPEVPSEATWGQADPLPQPAVETPKKDISLALFDAGLNSYHSRDYAAAEKSFRDFLKNYPSHTQTADAQYYLADSMFQRNQFPEAALAYDTVIKKYPKSSNAPAAYLKQAISFSKMKQPAAAKARMQEVISKFPKSSEAARARAFLKTNK
ncbi:MAG: tol-pal system protein YbgF [Desulfovibrio sp.]|nr:tol-pal system protein YbgF [Desulfovibrio sp.]